MVRKTGKIDCLSSTILNGLEGTNADVREAREVENDADISIEGHEEGLDKSVGCVARRPG